MQHVPPNSSSQIPDIFMSETQSLGEGLMLLVTLIPRHKDFCSGRGLIFEVLLSVALKALHVQKKNFNVYAVATWKFSMTGANIGVLQALCGSFRG